LAEASLPVNEKLVARGAFTFQSGYDALRAWARSGRLPDAVFAADDNTAFGVVDAARELGIAVPEKLAVIGFDDHPFAATSHPPMSSVRQPAEEMGALGVEMLREMLGARPARATTVVLKPRLVLRATTRPQ
ncbi:MAG TPA: substrate-binding domain-containing protein, partial [Spirochaetia bacterium]